MEGSRGGKGSPKKLLQLLVDLVESGFQFLAVGMVDCGNTALDQILEFDVAKVELHRSIRLLDAGVQDLGPKHQRVLEKFHLRLRQAEPMAFFGNLGHWGLLLSLIAAGFPGHLLAALTPTGRVWVF
jgi:hypothetical protein